MAITTKEQQLIDITFTLLEGFQHIPVHNEVGFPKESSGKRSKIIFTYNNWNLNFPFWFWLNNQQNELIKDTDFSLDDAKGEITLLTSSGSIFATDKELKVGQELESSYHFKYFNDQELLNWMEIGLIFLNNERPVTQFINIDIAPQEFTGALIIYTYYRALQKILLDNQLWNNNLIWADTRAFHGQVHALKTEAENEWKSEKQKAKPRSLVAPRGITGGRFATQQRVTGTSFRQFTIIGSTL